MKFTGNEKHPFRMDDNTLLQKSAGVKEPLIGSNLCGEPTTGQVHKKEEAGDNIKAAIEAMLFASDRPLTIEQIRRVLDGIDSSFVKEIVDSLRKEYEESNRGIRIYDVAGGFQMIANPAFAVF